MSGFLGILNTGGGPSTERLARRMLGVLVPGGPDRQDLWCDGPVVLGHALLSDAIGSPRVFQPCSLDGQVWVAADARLDRRDDLRRRLPGTIALDATDPELLLHGYRAWGDRCVEHLHGEFAFVLWDGWRRRLLCARDHFGQRPCYYAAIGDWIVVSSGLDSVRSHPDVSDRLNEHVLGDFLLGLPNQDLSATTFADVRQLPPAHVLTWDGRLGVRRYWTLAEPFARLGAGSDREYVERFDAAFREAVGERIRTDRVAAHLSGGLDSTSIVTAAHAVLRSRGTFDLRAFTVVFPELFDEEEGVFASEVAATLGIRCDRIVGDDFLTRTPESAPTWVFPEPCVIAEQTPACEIWRRTARFSRLLLTGFGGDALLTDGRTVWDLIAAADRGRTARDLLRGWFVHGCRPPLGLRSMLRRWTSRSIPPKDVPPWIDPEFARRTSLADRWRQVQADLIARRRIAMDRLLSPLWTNIFNWSHPAFTGVPARAAFPFFDLRLIEVIATVPPFPWRQNKRILRDAMQGRLPERVRNRPKRLLCPPARRGDPTYPWYKLASMSSVRHWRSELVRQTPALDQFAQRDRLTRVIETPDPAVDHGALNQSLVLAHWLCHLPRVGRENGELNEPRVKLGT